MIRYGEESAESSVRKKLYESMDDHAVVSIPEYIH